MRFVLLLTALLLVFAAPADAAESRFSVTVEGKGADVIMIPGLMSSRSVWDGAVASLDGKYRVHRIQIGGFAGEPVGANGDGPLLAALVEELAAYIRQEKLDRPAIVGHSMGGFLGLMLAERHPQLVGKLMIVDALPFYSMLMSPDATAASVEPQAAAFRTAIGNMSDEAFRAQQAGTVASLVASAAARPALLEQSVRSDRRVVGQVIYEVMTGDMRASLPRVGTPTTVVYATNAFATAERVGPLYGAYKAAPNAKLVAVADSFHFVMLDQPERFAAILGDFLTQS